MGLEQVLLGMVSAVGVEWVPEVIGGMAIEERTPAMTRTAMRERVPEVIAGTVMAEWVVAEVRCAGWQELSV